MRKIFLFFISLITFSCSKTERVIEPVLVQKILTYGGSNNDVAQSVAPTSDGGFIVLGYTQSNDGDIDTKQDESFDFWLLKFDQEASLQWSKTYGGANDDRGRNVIQTADGGYALVGYSNSSDGDVSENNGARDFWIIKTDNQGEVLWEKSFGFLGNDEGYNIKETSNGSFLVGGTLDVTASNGEGNTSRRQQKHAGGDYWLLNISANGDLIWSRYFGGSFTDIVHDVTESENGEFFAIGSSDSEDVDISNNKGAYDFWIVKTTSSGNMIWEKSYGGSEIDEARSIANTSDGNYIIVGDTRSNNQDVTINNGGADLWMIKISSQCNILWNRSIGGSSFDVSRSIKSTANNGFVIAGSSRSFDGDVSKNQGQNDAWIVKVDNNGNLLWEQTFGGSEIDFAYDVAQLRDGTFVLVGETQSNDGDILENKGFSDLLIITLK